MQQNAIQRKLIQLMGQNEKLCYLAARAKDQAFLGNYVEYNGLMEEMVCLYRKTETTARNLLLHSAFVDKYRVIATVAHTMEIEVTLEAEGWYRIIIPAIVPKKLSGCSCDFITEPLAFKLDQYVLQKGPLHVPLKDCIVMFREVYDREMPARMIRDADNTEYKKVLDVVAARLMRDDNGLFCETSHQIVPGENEQTEIYVIPDALISLWRDKYPKYR